MQTHKYTVDVAHPMFGTSGVRGVVGESITPELALSIGAAAGAEANTVTVARDPRVTGEALADGAAAGARQVGADVQRLGVTTTPTAARYAEDTALVITASHNPAEYNGFKLFNSDGTSFDETQRKTVEDHVEDPPLTSPEEFGNSQERTDADESHLDAVLEAVEDCDISVVVDGAGGAASEITPRVLSAMGCSVYTVNCRFDGRFQNREPEPVDEHLTTLKQAVQAYDADVGVAHDGDGDRAAAVDSSGEYVEPDRLLAAFARHEDASHVVTPVNTSQVVDEVAEVTRTEVGDVAVARELKESGGVFGGEPSNTWIFPESTLCPDGVLAAAKLAEMADRGLESYLEDLPEYVTLRDSIGAPEKDTVMENVEDRLTKRYGDLTTVDGVRVEVEDGWFLVRASGTEPLVRVTAEAESSERAEDLLEVAYATVEEAVNEVEG